MDRLRESQARSVIGDWGLERFEPRKGLARKSEIKDFMYRGPKGGTDLVFRWDAGGWVGPGWYDTEME